VVITQGFKAGVHLALAQMEHVEQVH